MSIMGGSLFEKVAAAARLKKKDFQRPSKTPMTYGRQPFKVHGKMSLRVAFGDKEVVTPVYINMDADEPLLLAEGACYQLGMVSYHPEDLKGSTHAPRKKETEPEKREDPVHVHLSRARPAPQDAPAGQHWYDRALRGPGRPPPWTGSLQPEENTVEPPYRLRSHCPPAIDQARVELSQGEG